MLLEKNSTLLFTGDSVTDCGRVRPLGEGNFGQLGNGYVGIVQSLLDVYLPKSNIRVLNSGISGNRARDLKERWQSDTIDYKPDYVAIMVGINDIWHQHITPRCPYNIVTLEDYKAALETIIVSSLENGVKKIILFTPFYIEPNKNETIRAAIDTFGNAVKELASKYNCILADAQAAFDEACKYNHSCFYSSDRVHPNQTGHTVLAKAFLDAIEAKI